MSHMRSSTKASQTCCIIKSFAPSQLHGLPQTHSVTATITVGGKEKSHLKALSSQVIYVALMMKAVTQAGWAQPPTPLSLLGTATQVNQFIHSVTVWGHHTPAVHN